MAYRRFACPDKGRRTRAITSILILPAFCAVALSLVQCSSSSQQKSTDDTMQVETQAHPQQFSLDYLQGKFDPAAHPDFVAIDTLYADRPGLYLRKDAYEAFIRMYDAAQQDGIHLVIRSATRNFEYQKGIWERKWTGETRIEADEDASVKYPDSTERAKAILRFSSMPGTSRHHWGTDIDLNAFENSWFETGEGKNVYAWLTVNAGMFGYCQPYTAKGEDRRFGYEEEKWHWSYYPVSTRLTLLARDSLANDMITGFKGSSTATDVDAVGKYVLGINPDCIAM